MSARPTTYEVMQWPVVKAGSVAVCLLAREGITLDQFITCAPATLPSRGEPTAP